MNKKYFFLILFLSFNFQLFSEQKKYKIHTLAFYNVENLFDTINDVNKNDEASPIMEMNYNRSKVYSKKLLNTSKVISGIGLDETKNLPTIGIISALALFAMVTFICQTTNQNEYFAIAPLRDIPVDNWHASNEQPSSLHLESEKEEEVALVYQSHNTVAGVQLDYKKDPMRFLRRSFLKIPSNIIRKFLNIFGFFITKLNGLIAKFGLIFGNYYQYSFEFFFSQSQEENNKIFLDKNSSDKFGLKKVNIDWNISLNDQNTYNEIINFLVGQNGVLKKNNIKNDFIKNFYKSGLSGLHPSCTTRMGKDKTDSVVDGNLKIHNTKNVFICGSSVFPVNGITNPTWTIMTLANRLAKYLAKIK